MDLLSVVSSGFKLPNAASVAILASVHILAVVLTLVIPGAPFKGAPLKDRPSIIYKMNGLAVHIVAMILFVVCSNWGLNLYNITIIYDNYGPLLTTAILYSIAFNTFLYLRATYWIPAKDQNYQSSNAIMNYWCGIELNPIFFGFEIKFWSYRPGFILMSLINLSVLFYQYEKVGTFSTPMLLFQFINLFYVVDAFYFESGMTYMFDIIEENFGFMLVFGDYVWIPFVFSLQSLYLVDAFQISTLYIFINLAVLAVGYTIFRNSNYQKLQFRLNPKALIEGKPPKVVKTGREGRDLLISGWWGRARKINYTGDILIAIAMSMPCELYVLAYLYPIYLTILLINRAHRDDLRCREKYKECWTEYCSKVKYVMIPGIY